MLSLYQMPRVIFLDRVCQRFVNLATTLDRIYLAMSRLGS